MSEATTVPTNENASSFGELAGGEAGHLYTLENRHLRVGITDYGGRVVSIEAADRAGRREHVVLGFGSAAEYANAEGAFGALLGRTANRIAGGQFTLDGKTYALSKNEGTSTLHGGEIGFDRVLWKLLDLSATELVLTHLSPDGDQGFPGAVTVRTTYRLEDHTFWIEFAAATNRPTPLSLSAHPYFNLAGVDAGDIGGHLVEIAADHFLPTDEKQIPTGEIRPVSGTVFDFRTAAALSSRIRRPDPQLLLARGFDHYFVLNKQSATAPQLAARLREPSTGRVLEVLTTQLGTQFYTGNNLNGSVAGRGGAYRQSAGFAIEPQGFPDAPNRPEFPTTILRPEQTYRESIGYRLTAA